jgi:hypothetical protein
MVFPNVEKSVAPEPKRLMNLKVEADGFHCIGFLILFLLFI